MKKIITLSLFLILAVTAANAQDEVPKRHYINLAFVNQELKFDGFYSRANTTDPQYYEPARNLKSDQGFAAEFGSSFFFNGRKPILGMVRIGLDFSYLDLQYASFKEEYYGETYDSHFVNLGMQVGPSVTVTPFEKLHFKAYGHYAPSFAAFSPEGWDNVKFGYAGYITYGVQASYRFLTVGVEMRSATANMNVAYTDEDSVDSGDMFDKDVKIKTKMPNTRFIVGFRF